MTSQQSIEQPAASQRDMAVLLLAAAIFVGGVVAFYYFAGQIGLTLRTVMLLGIMGAAVALAYQTSTGKTMWAYGRGMNVELRKTTWPTKQESLQATLMIAAVVLITSLIMWGLDSALLWGVKSLTGHG